MQVGFQLRGPLGEGQSIAQLMAVFVHELLVLVHLATVQPDDGVQVLELPFAPLVEGAVHHGVIIPGVDEEHLVPQGFLLSFIKEPQRTGQALGVEKVVAHADHDIHMPGLHQLLADILVLALAVGGGGGHNKAGAAVLVQVGVEIGNPQVVGVADLLVFVDGRQAKGKSSGAQGGLGLDLVHVKRRIGHDVITATRQVVRVMVEGVGFVAGLNDAVQPMHGQIHLTQLGVVFHLFLTIKGHGVVGPQSGALHEVAGLHEHAAAAAGGVQQYALFGLQHVDDHLDQRLGGEEYAIILSDVFGKFIEEILIDATDDVTTHIIQRAVIEDAQQFRQQLIGKHGIRLGQYAGELLALLLHQFHGVIHGLAQAAHDLAPPVGEAGGGNILRQVHQIGILRLAGQEQGAAGDKVAGLHRKHAPAANRTILEDFRLHELKAAVRIAQKDQPQHGHAVLIGGQLGAGPQQVGRFPQFGFQLANIDHRSSSGTYSIISPKSVCIAAQIFSSTARVTASSRFSLVMVLGAIPVALRRSALLIFWSISSFQSLLYETAIYVSSTVSE